MDTQILTYSLSMLNSNLCVFVLNTTWSIYEMAFIAKRNECYT